MREILGSVFPREKGGEGVTGVEVETSRRGRNRFAQADPPRGGSDRHRVKKKKKHKKKKGRGEPLHSQGEPPPKNKNKKKTTKKKPTNQTKNKPKTNTQDPHLKNQPKQTPKTPGKPTFPIRRKRKGRQKGNVHTKLDRTEKA